MQPWRLTRPKVGRRPGHAAAAAGRDDAAERFAADGEADEAGDDGGRRAGRRAAGAFLGVPRVAGHAAEPLVAQGQRAERELGDEHGAGVFEPARRRSLCTSSVCS